MHRTQTSERAGTTPALIVILAGVCAALHVGKLPPAIPALQLALGVTLVEAGFLLSLVQMAGMLLGIAVGLAADGLGPRRSMVSGLLVLSAASALGGWARDAPLLMLLRACEGFGFLLVVLPAPGLIRRLMAPQRMSLMLGAWGAYMPLGAATALLIGPLWIGAFGWRAWWWMLAGVSLLMAVVLLRTVPAIAAQGSTTSAATHQWLARLRQTLASRGSWLVAWTFALYSSQWLAVIGFLPVIYTQAGVSGAATGMLTALAAAVNIVGNLGAGRRLHRGARPAVLLSVGFSVMGLAAIAAFAGSQGSGLPPAPRYIAVLVFSTVGGAIPATLFSLAVRVAPNENTLSTTVGWVQQWSAFGQFAGPPLVAWVASRSGDWQWTWLVTGACSVLGLVLVWRMATLGISSNAAEPPRT